MIEPPVPIGLTVLPDVPCPYLPGRVETLRAVMASRIDAGTYRAFMDAGFRRSGRMIYQPVCRDCRECRTIRLATADFVPTASQRRCFRKNGDLTVNVAAPLLTDEKADLYARYVREWHRRPDDGDAESLRRFLYDSPTDTLEFTYRDPAGRLLAVGICDVSAASLSSVYFYFDPADAARGLGTFGVLKEIEWARAAGIGYYYLGFWVRDCPDMSYKANFRPAEVLGEDGRFYAIDERP